LPRSSHIPERTCIACGQKLPKRELIRVVRTPQGQITADPTGRIAGRGAYLCGAPECWKKGIYSGGLDRGLKASLSAQEQELLLDFYQEQATKNIAVES
jgi:hypothetical protein